METNMSKIYVRELTPDSDARAFQSIAHGEALHEFASFFEVASVQEAREKIKSFHTFFENVYGLFDMFGRLVAVFHTNKNLENGFTVNYFVGERYLKKNYAVCGLRKLAKELAGKGDYFYFQIRRQNVSSLRVQQKLGSKKVHESQNHIAYRYDFNDLCF